MTTIINNPTPVETGADVGFGVIIGAIIAIILIVLFVIYGIPGANKAQDNQSSTAPGTTVNVSLPANSPAAVKSTTGGTTN